jgi:hypothetical protein
MLFLYEFVYVSPSTVVVAHPNRRHPSMLCPLTLMLQSCQKSIHSSEFGNLIPMQLLQKSVYPVGKGFFPIFAIPLHRYGEEQAA